MFAVIALKSIHKKTAAAAYIKNVNNFHINNYKK